MALFITLFKYINPKRLSLFALTVGLLFAITRLYGHGAHSPIPTPVTIEPLLNILDRFIYLGFTQLIPYGIPTILFIVSLYLAPQKIVTYVFQALLFTLSHYVATSLSLLAIITLPTGLNEAIVMLSISLIAIINIVQKRISIWRFLLVFCLGLFHGMNVSNSLLDIALPPQRFIASFFAFNTGIELAHLVLLGTTIAVTIWFNQKSWYRPYIILPFSLITGVIGLFWFVQKLTGIS